MNKTTMFMMGAALVCAMASTGCQDEYEVKTPSYKTGLATDTLSAAPFEKVFPRQYASYRQNDESSVMTEYKGSVAFQKHHRVIGPAFAENLRKSKFFIKRHRSLRTADQREVMYSLYHANLHRLFVGLPGF